MAITFIQQKRRQRYLIWILGGVLLFGLIFLVWQLFLKSESIPESEITSPEISRMAKKIDINFDVLRKPISVVLPDFSLALSAEPASGSPPLKGVSLIVSLSGPIVGPITYKFDCNDDGIFENEAKDTFDKKYTAKGICDYEKEGDYTAVVYAELSLTYSSQNGEKLTEDKVAMAQINIPVKTQNHNPVISRCDVSPNEGSTQVNFNFNFTVEASDTDKDKLNYLWEFGDGQTSSEQNSGHNYARPGIYLPKVTVSDGRGGEDKCYPFSLSLLGKFQLFEETPISETKIGRENPFKAY